MSPPLAFWTEDDLYEFLKTEGVVDERSQSVERLIDVLAELAANELIETWDLEDAIRGAKDLWRPEWLRVDVRHLKVAEVYRLIGALRDRGCGDVHAVEGSALVYRLERELDVRELAAEFPKAAWRLEQFKT